MTRTAKFALIVGHNSLKQGAVRSDTNESEFTFNSRVAKYAEEYAKDRYPQLTVRTFFRTAGLGYSREIRMVYDETDRWGADLTNELHFNSHAGAGRGCETLTSGTASSFKFAQITQNLLVARFDLKDRGIVTRKTGRGSASLIAGRAPAILSEPFFGSHKDNQAMFDEHDEEVALAQCYIDAAAEALEVLPRKDIEESRTKQKTAQQRTLAKLGKAGVTTSLGAGGLDKAGVFDAIEIGERIEGAVPWLVGGGLVIALLVLYGIPWLADHIDVFREEDHDKELR